jgi:predicted metal-dependent hydrolase
MTQLARDRGFAEGIRFFNQGNFFEAHELWEQEWKVAEGEEKIFYQGIIQAAAALLHIQRGNYAGAVSVYLKSWAKLARLPEVWMGIELGQFRSELREYFALLRNSSSISCRNCQSLGAGQIASIAQLPTIRWAFA